MLEPIFLDDEAPNYSLTRDFSCEPTYSWNKFLTKTS